MDTHGKQMPEEMSSADSAVLPLVPPTPAVADTEAKDDAEYPFGMAYTLAEWRAAARVYTANRRARNYSIISTAYGCCLPMFGVLAYLLHVNVLLLTLIAFVVLAMTVTPWCLQVLPPPIRQYATATNLIIGGVLVLIITPILILLPLGVGKIMVISFAAWGISLILNGVELRMIAQRLGKITLPTPALWSAFTSRLSHPWKPSSSHEQLIELKVLFASWRILLLDGYALAVLKNNRSAIFVRREELSLTRDLLQPTADTRVTAHLGKDAVIKGRMTQRDFERYQGWMAEVRGH